MRVLTGTNASIPGVIFTALVSMKLLDPGRLLLLPLVPLAPLVLPFITSVWVSPFSTEGHMFAWEGKLRTQDRGYNGMKWEVGQRSGRADEDS